mmetsp:Transcript_9719/g.31944  ORF Transcript_9719/g.31944 Transcript_9719/m.31944 type:complete len:236 (+) Transcript_9719:565-1272(+)
MDKNDDPCGDPDDVRVARCGSPASDLVFHRVEFCSSFVYACVEAAALAYTPRAISSISRRPMLLRMLLFFDIVATFVPAALVVANLDAFEVAAHEIEWCNELTMSFVNLIVLESLVRRRRGATAVESRATVLLAGLVSAAAPLFQLFIYNCTPAPNGERVAHFSECIFCATGAFVTFWFCLDNWAAAEEEEVHCIMYGRGACDDCTAYDAVKTLELVDSPSLNGAARARKGAHLV